VAQDQTSLTKSDRSPRVRLRERAIDLVAATCLVGGVALFLFARRALGSLAAGTYDAPGGTMIAHTDFHVTQSRLGIWLVAAGLTLAAAAAISHAQRRAR
jgi:hypothetical protein